jgi:NIPSNAP
VIYELRIYRTHPGRMAALTTRFRDHTLSFFAKHGIESVGYWTTAIGGRSDELWYIVRYPDHAAREASWAAFLADPDWHAVATASEADGPIVHHIETRILAPTDFSPLT